MLILKHIFGLLTGGALLLNGGAPRAKATWIVQKSSSLSITGRTNVNSFCCQITQYEGPDTIGIVPVGAEGGNVFLHGGLAIEVKDFVCTNKMMTKEFKNTLKYHEHPQLKVGFISLERLPVATEAVDTVKGVVEVELAGVAKKFLLSYAASSTDANTMELVGTRDFGFSEFGLQPPRKMAGLVKVADRLDVHFHLFLKKSL